MRREPLVALGLATLAVVVLVREPAAARLGPSAPCADAVVLDGTLRCDDEARRSVAQACPGEAVLVAGDVLTSPACERGERMPPDDLQALRVPIDANTASLDDLCSLHRVGPVVARRIVEGRPYASADELDRVKGIGPKTLAGIRDRVRVQPPRIGPGRPRPRRRRRGYSGIRVGR